MNFKCLMLLLGSLTLWQCGSGRADEAAKDPVTQAREFYATMPEIMRPFPHTEVPKGLPDLSAATCGSCHQEIYQEWRVSTHAHAWLDDAQFQEELNKPDFNGSKGADVRWLCINCHTPLENQLERLVTGLENDQIEKPIYTDNPHFDPKLQLEAITCAGCHVRDGVVLGPYGDQSKSPHPVKKAPELQTERVCTQCHQANAHFPEVSLACFFDTGAELKASPYWDKGYICQSCHMPEVERPLVAGGQVRKTRRHWFGGSMIPKKPEYEAELAPIRKHFPDGLRLGWLNPPKSLKPRSDQTVTIEFENAEAGHLLSTGDPERFIVIEAKITDRKGEVLAETSYRIGTQFQWHPEVKKLSDNRLKPKEKRTLDLTFKAPKKGPVTLHLKATKWRLSQENFEYHHLEGRYVANRVFFDEKHQIPVEP